MSVTSRLINQIYSGFVTMTIEEILIKRGMFISFTTMFRHVAWFISISNWPWSNIAITAPYFLVCFFYSRQFIFMQCFHCHRANIPMLVVRHSVPNYNIQGGVNIRIVNPVIQYEQIEVQNEHAICCICREPLKGNKDCRSMVKCKHVMHKECIDTWATHRTVCPLCIQSIG
jgi:hypothetical protein